jgi:hypothetical protein
MVQRRGVRGTVLVRCGLVLILRSLGKWGFLMRLSPTQTLGMPHGRPNVRKLAFRCICKLLLGLAFFEQVLPREAGVDALEVPRTLFVGINCRLPDELPTQSIISACPLFFFRRRKIF